jgi:hypothetical protein
MTEPRPFYSHDELRIVHDVEHIDVRFGALAYSCTDRPGESEADRDRMRDIVREVSDIVRRNAERRALHAARIDAEHERPYL